MDGRDALWEHPDMLPTATDLDDPDGFVHREQLDFSELDRMLGEAAGSTGPKPGTDETDGPGADEPGTGGPGTRPGTDKSGTDKSGTDEDDSDK
jgi:hypothetical protein